MSENIEMGKGTRCRTRARPGRNMLEQRSSAARIFARACLALLVMASVAASPRGQAALPQQKADATQFPSAPQSTQARPALSLLSPAPAKPVTKISRPAAAPPPPQTPPGPPHAPVLFAPPNGTTGATVSPTLDVSVTDPAGSNLSVTFYGKVASTVGPNFT